MIVLVSQNIKWETTVDKNKVGHKLIRRVSLDQFYSLVTGEKNAFYQLCMVLPDIIKKSVNELGKEIVPDDTVLEELNKMSEKFDCDSKELSIVMAIYMLGFKDYIGFK